MTTAITKTCLPQLSINFVEVVCLKKQNPSIRGALFNNHKESYLQQQAGVLTYGQLSIVHITLVCLAVSLPFVLLANELSNVKVVKLRTIIFFILIN